MTTNPLIALFEEWRASTGLRTPFDAVQEYPDECDVEEDGQWFYIFLAMGRQQPLGVWRQPPGTSGAQTATVNQITLRDIYLAPSLRGKGYMHGLIDHLLALPGVEAVQIEAVCRTSLREHLQAEPDTWVCQTAPEYAGFNPSFVRFK